MEETGHLSTNAGSQNAYQLDRVHVFVVSTSNMQWLVIEDTRSLPTEPTYSLPSTARLSREVGSHRTTSTFTSSINLTNNLHTTTIPTTTIINYSMLAQAAIAFHEPVAR